MKGAIVLFLFDGQFRQRHAQHLDLVFATQDDDIKVSVMNDAVRVGRVAEFVAAAAHLVAPFSKDEMPVEPHPIS